MSIIRLHWRARQALERLAQSSSDGRQVRRALALVWLHQGESVATVAQRLGLSRRAIYKVVERYQARQREPTRQRVRDRAHPGRPANKRHEVMQVVDKILLQASGEYGYKALAWTTPLLQRQAERRLGTEVSEWTVRRALHALRYGYKRPRYVLARRSPTWRQAKGGSNAASKGGVAA